MTLTIHETANQAVGAGAAAHANLQSRGNVREASWHWQVDDKEAVQSFAHTTQCWHAGDGRGPGNLDSIAIEICVNSDGDYLQAVRNTAELVGKILTDEKIPISAVVQHGKWSGKNCPTFLRAGSKGITWAGFLDLIRTGTPTTPAPNPLTPAKPVPVSKSRPVLRRGAKGGDVGDLQRLLNAKNKAGLVVDGSFGPKTEAAVAAWQKKSGLVVDKSVGPKTWASLGA